MHVAAKDDGTEAFVDVQRVAGVDVDRESNEVFIYDFTGHSIGWYAGAEWERIEIRQVQP